MKRITSILCFLAITAIYCNRAEIPPESPLTDLPWLKEKIDEINFLIQEHQLLSVGIYQCIYDNGKIGFLEEHHHIAYFYNCEGKILGIMGKFEEEACSELNITSKELIWNSTLQ